MFGKMILFVLYIQVYISNYNINEQFFTILLIMLFSSVVKDLKNVKIAQITLNKACAIALTWLKAYLQFQNKQMAMQT